MASDFSLWRDSPPYRIARRLRLVTGGAADPIRLAGIIAALVYLPYLAIGLVEAAATGEHEPLLLRPEVHLRWLLTVPALFASDVIVAREMSRNLSYLRDTGIVSEADEPRLDRARDRATRLACSATSWAILAAIAFVVGLPLVLTVDGPVHGWHALVAMPVFRTLWFAWLLRWLLWATILWTIVRIGPRLVATHPDGAGGLVALGWVNVGYGLGAFGVSGLLSVFIAEEVLAGASLSSFAAITATWVACAVVLAALPSVTLTLPLLKARQDARVRYSAFLYQHARAFEERWVTPPHGRDALGAPDVSSLADATSSWEPVRTMRIFPLSREQLVATAVLVALPLLPLVLLQMPLREVLRWLMGLLV